MKIPNNFSNLGYPITVKRGILAEIENYFDLNRKVLVVTDSGVPKQYAQAVARKCKEAKIIAVPQGEESKSFEKLEHILSYMLENNFTRTDCVVAVGGGVVGDLAGFASATFMRGIDFYNFPTTLLSQVDSSVGGKTAINLGGYKNCVGAFYRPKAVAIDPDVLITLSERQIASGMAEALKMAVCFDEELFNIFELKNTADYYDEIITRSLQIKAFVVENDEKEADLRRALNFGHTIGHGIEVNSSLLHGECVALGMLPMTAKNLHPRLKFVLKKLGLPCVCPETADGEAIFDAVSHDKKLDGEEINLVICQEIGKFEFKKVLLEEFMETVLEIKGGEEL